MRAIDALVIERHIARFAADQAVLMNEMCCLPKDSYAFQRRKLGAEVLGFGIVIWAHLLSGVSRDRILEAFGYE